MIPRQLVSFSKNVDKKLKKEILDILLNMHKDNEGIKVLEKFSKTKKFSVLKKDELQLKELLN
jgi:ABC-type phosphate/phosphonate transport system substrate-binding protein